MSHSHYGREISTRVGEATRVTSVRMPDGMINGDAAGEDGEMIPAMHVNDGGEDGAGSNAEKQHSIPDSESRTTTGDER